MSEDLSHNYLKRTEKERAQRDLAYGVPWRVKVAKGLGVLCCPDAEVTKRAKAERAEREK